MNGKNGLSVVRSVEVEFLTERGNVINPNVHIPTIKNVMEAVMKRRSVMNIAVQVCKHYESRATQNTMKISINRKTILGRMGGLDCV